MREAAAKRSAFVCGVSARKCVISVSAALCNSPRKSKFCVFSHAAKHDLIIRTASCLSPRVRKTGSASGVVLLIIAPSERLKTVQSRAAKVSSNTSLLCVSRALL